MRAFSFVPQYFVRHNKVGLFFRIVLVYDDQELIIAEGKVEPHRFSILVKALVNNVIVEDHVVRFKPGDFYHLFILSHNRASPCVLPSDLTT